MVRKSIREICPKTNHAASPRIGFLTGISMAIVRFSSAAALVSSPESAFRMDRQPVHDAGMLQVTSTFVGQANTPGPSTLIRLLSLGYRSQAGTVVPSNHRCPGRKFFKMPNLSKPALGLTKRLAKTSSLTVEGLFMKDINNAVFTNPNLVDPAPLGVDWLSDNWMFYPNPTNLEIHQPADQWNLQRGDQPEPQLPW